MSLVGFLIHIYSAEFTMEDEGYSRFFAYMNLFVASMITLLLGDNLLLLMLGWEGVGLCSYLCHAGSSNDHFLSLAEDQRTDCTVLQERRQGVFRDSGCRISVVRRLKTYLKESTMSTREKPRLGWEC